MLKVREIMCRNKFCHSSAINMKPQGIKVSQQKSQAPNTKTLKPHGTYLYLSLLSLLLFILGSISIQFNSLIS